MQQENQDVLFGTSVVGGFNRRNVLSYIEKLQNQLTRNGIDADALSHAEADLAALREQMQTAEDALTAVRQENETLRAQLEAARLEARQARAEADKLRAAKAAASRRTKK